MAPRWDLVTHNSCLTEAWNLRVMSKITACLSKQLSTANILLISKAHHENCYLGKFLLQKYINFYCIRFILSHKFLL